VGEEDGEDIGTCWPREKGIVHRNIMKKSILYISTTLPTPGFGSSVIFYRHLKRLEGWKISIASFKQEPKAEHRMPKDWQIISLPEPALRHPVRGARLSFLTNLRMKPLINKCVDVFKDDKPSAILNQLGKNSIWAFYLSKALKIPLNVVIHDRWQVWTKAEVDKLFMTEKWAIKILNHASRVWAVSEELAKFYKVSNPEKVKVLYPISESGPEGFVEWRDDFKTSPVIGFTGSFHSPQIEHFKDLAAVLKDANGRLFIITKKNDLIKERLPGIEDIEYHEPFTESSGVIKLLKERVSVMLVCGSIEPNAPGAELSFPSRLVEFMHLGVPIIIIAASGTALSSWAKRHKWPTYLEPQDKEKLSGLLKQLMDRENWGRIAEEVRRVARDEFSPDKIQAQFEKELVRKDCL